MISDMYKSEEACKNCGCKIIYYKNVGHISVNIVQIVINGLCG